MRQQTVKMKAFKFILKNHENLVAVELRNDELYLHVNNYCKLSNKQEISDHFENKWHWEPYFINGPVEVSILEFLTDSVSNTQCCITSKLPWIEKKLQNQKHLEQIDHKFKHSFDDLKRKSDLFMTPKKKKKLNSPLPDQLSGLPNENKSRAVNIFKNQLNAATPLSSNHGTPVKYGVPLSVPYKSLQTPISPKKKYAYKQPSAMPIIASFSDSFSPKNEEFEFSIISKGKIKALACVPIPVAKASRSSSMTSRITFATNAISNNSGRSETLYSLSNLLQDSDITPRKENHSATLEEIPCNPVETRLASSPLRDLSSETIKLSLLDDQPYSTTYENKPADNIHSPIPSPAKNTVTKTPLQIISQTSSISKEIVDHNKSQISKINEYQCPIGGSKPAITTPSAHLSDASISRDGENVIEPVLLALVKESNELSVAVSNSDSALVGSQLLKISQVFGSSEYQSDCEMTVNCPCLKEMVFSAKLEHCYYKLLLV
eukprot:NODE_603_length_6200_cov_0.292739.p1 type:complete len:491 gc:universal NODE_603_length_6200_cov_0.292739:4043-5515(+)